MPETNYPARKRLTGIRNRDAVDPLFREAEDRVYRWLTEQGYTVRDARAQRTYHDFMIGVKDREALFALDVKTDQYAHSTGCVAWELYLDYRDRVLESWGLDNRLSYVAYVMPQDWSLLLVDAECVRSLVTAPHETLGAGTRPFTRQGLDGRTAIGLVLPIEWLREHGCVKREEKLTEV